MNHTEYKIGDKIAISERLDRWFYVYRVTKDAEEPSTTYYDGVFGGLGMLFTFSSNSVENLLPLSLVDVMGLKTADDFDSPQELKDYYEEIIQKRAQVDPMTQDSENSGASASSEFTSYRDMKAYVDRLITNTNTIGQHPLTKQDVIDIIEEYLASRPPVPPQPTKGRYPALCPKCNGEGIVPDKFPTTSTQFTTCGVCNGAKIFFV